MGRVAIRLPRIAPVAAAAALLTMVCCAGAAPAHAQAFDVPPGFVVVDEPEISPGGDWRGVVMVRPEPGPFSDLSTIRLREVTVEVDDPDEWLRDRMSADIGGEEAAKSLLDSPDSPFGDPAFDKLRETLPQVFRQLDELSKLPLEFCEGPDAAYNAAGRLRELYCVYQAGPFRQFLILRLQEADGRWFYTEIRAMNEKRLRHLIAIANSFRMGI